jgi:D-alanyl-D-alanine carboxypeptidase
MATAALVLRLAQQGQLGLDDALGRYVGYLPGADRITVRMLLAHRSGLPDYLSPSFGEIVGGFADPAHAWTREEILRAIDPDDDVRPPGEAYRYSQTDYVALGVVLEQASGTPVDALFRQLIAAPLGLERCLFDRDPAIAPDVAHGFAYDGARRDYVSLFPANGSVPTFLWGPVWTDNGIMCTAGDAARFTDALFRGRLVSPDSLALMTRFGSESYGHGVARKTDTGHLLHGHAGARPGYGAAAWYDPEARLTIVALVNADGPGFLAGTLHQRMDEAYRRGAPP